MSKRGRPDKGDYFAIGMILSVVTLFWSAYTYQACGTVFDECSLNPIKEWQTLIAGSLAVVAAFATIWHTNSVNRDKYKRIANSHKAVLSNVLSMINEELKNDFNTLEGYKKSLKIDPGKELPEFSWSQEINFGVETIRLVIESDKYIAKEVDILEIMLATMQIYKSRRNWKQGTVDSTKMKKTLSNIKDCIELYGIVASLFNYARPPSLQFNIGLSEYDANRITRSMFLGAYSSIANLITTPTMKPPSEIHEMSETYPK